MVNREEVLKDKIEFSGIFDFAGLYFYAHSWFVNRGLGIDEKKYVEKTDGKKRDMEIEWETAKGISDYFKEEYKIKFRTEKLVEVEVEIDKQKKKMTEGKIIIEIGGTLITDSDNKWESSAFSRFVRDSYDKYIIPARVNKAKEKIIDNVKEFIEEIKTFLDITGRR